MTIDRLDPLDTTVLVSQCYRDEAVEMEAAEGAFMWAAPEPRPIEEQLAFDRGAVAEASVPIRALGDGCFERVR